MYLITGGTGYIGSSLIKKLESEGKEILVYSNFTNGKCTEYHSKNISIVRGSILDNDILNDTFMNNNIEGVYHFSAISDIRESIIYPINTFQINVVGTVNLLEAMRKHDVKNMVFASTSAVYGSNNPISGNKETDLPMPISPYATTKQMAESYCNIYSKQYSMCVKSLRYFNVYGPGMNPKSPAIVVLKFLENICMNKSPIIFGDGTQTRDFIYIDDIIQANTKAMSSDKSGVYNIGTGIATSLNHLAEVIMNTTGVKLPIDYQNERSGDIKNSVADINLATNSFGFYPEYSLQQGIIETYKYFKQIHIVK